MEVLQMWKERVIKSEEDKQEVIRTEGRYYMCCDVCGKEYEAYDISQDVLDYGLVQGTMTCNDHFKTEEKQRDPWDDLEPPEDWLGYSIDDEDLPF